MALGQGEAAGLLATANQLSWVMRKRKRSRRRRRRCSLQDVCPVGFAPEASCHDWMLLAGIKELDILQLDQEQSGAAPPYPSPFLRLEAASAPPANPPSCQGWWGMTIPAVLPISVKLEVTHSACFSQVWFQSRGRGDVGCHHVLSYIQRFLVLFQNHCRINLTF